MEENRTEKKKRLITKMISTALITAGVAGLGAGIYICHDAVENNTDDYIDRFQYISGIVLNSASISSAGIGIGLYPFNHKKDKENVEEQEDILKK